MHQVSDKKLTITGNAQYAQWADVDPVSVDIASALKVLGLDTRFDADSSVAAGKKRSRAKTDMAASVMKWAFAGLMVTRSRELWLRFFNVVALVLAVVTFVWSPVTLWGVPLALFFPFTIAGGVAALWARKYQTTTGEVGPQPDCGEGIRQRGRSRAGAWAELPAA
ncbi:hypothetical protein MSAR_44570 [Mycolicibacterium sarraceniae]|uniref:Uncharacterized protein n=1 Tax=Mycolicibacterium sarraceniae TaxID=1534348 RepID=A0A7I7SYE6_9MYCO|nr:hypothetical protein MSAR_44570 [Mycolicibacterium sarraceniae]